LLVNSDGESKEIFVKKFGPNIKPGIIEIINLKEEWEQLLTPNIIDYIDEGNLLLLEGVEGETLSKNFLLYSLRLGGSARRNRLLECARKTGKAIGHLHRFTEKGKARIGSMKLYMVEQFNSGKYNNILGENIWAELNPRIAKFIDSNSKIAQYHGDPSPHNILLKGNNVFLLDFCYQNSSVYLDPVLFTVYLDLVSARFPYMNNVINQMKTEFLEAYITATGMQFEQDKWDNFEFLTYIHILYNYNKRSKNLKKYLVEFLDRKYIKDKIYHFI
jgi:tRNA A-37 threonylcarbamoyl transferase component Bud32